MTELMTPNPSRDVEVSLSALGGKWKVLILWYLKDTPKRYSTLRRLIPKISEKVLIRQLRQLEADGIVQRTDYQTIPPHVEYSLSEYGHGVLPVLDALCQWGRLHREQEH